MKKFLLLIILAISSLTAYSQQSCAQYPFDEGIDIQDVNGGTKILATAQASVSMDDIDSIKDAREEATLEAKALISKFMSEDIKSDSKIEKIVNESKQSDGKNIQIIRKELITRVKILRNTSQALLRGVVILGSCYTKSLEFRVTVGIKPETIKAAENLAGNIGRSLSSQGAPQSSNTPVNSGGGSQKNGQNNSLPLRGTEGYSNSEKINNF